MSLIVFDSPEVEEALRRKFENKMDWFTVIANVNYVDSPQDKRTDRRGLDFVPWPNFFFAIVILTSFEPEEELRKDPRFIQLMSNFNYIFLRLPATTAQYWEAYVEGCFRWNSKI